MWNSRRLAVRPYRADGYVNMINKYGTSKDSAEHYHFTREMPVADMQLAEMYEGNGLFAKIIDAPSEEAVKHGFKLNVENDELEGFVEDVLDDLEWEEKVTTAIKWARLFGGSVIVMLIDDGGGLETPVNWKRVRSIDELLVYERAVVNADYASLYFQDIGNSGRQRRYSSFGQPEFYQVSSRYGTFRVHESRCLVFKNGILPEQTTNQLYQFWGLPEFLRIRRALRDTVTTHENGSKLLERSVQAIYSMKDLSSILSTADGENEVLKRLSVIDQARGIMNSIAIDAEGESYDFKTFQFTGVKDVIDASCNMLSALTNIPQTILFGRSPAGMNATGNSDLENYYNFVERIQKTMLKKNIVALLDIAFQAGVRSGAIKEIPTYKIEFNPLWSLSEKEQVAVDQQRAATSQTKAATAQAYIDMGVLDPTEVRKKLAADEEFEIENIIDDDDEDFTLELPEKESPQQPQDTQQLPKQEAAAPTPAPQPPMPQGDARRDMQFDDDIDWITVKGTHIPLDESGISVGGPEKLRGKNLSNAKLGSNTIGKSRDLMSAAKSIANGMSNDDYTELNMRSQETGDQKIQKAYFEKLGMTGSPKVVSEDEFEKMESDYPVQYRGVETQKQADEYMYGEYFCGRGVNGAGTNMTPDKSTADKYARENGTIMKMKVSADAKVISLFELSKFLNEAAAASTNLSNNVEGKIADKLMNDPACVAASHGYDAIYDPILGWMNVFNRTKVIVVKSSNSSRRDMQFDAGDDDVEWITVNGSHIPIDKNGNAVGGPKELQDALNSSSKVSGKRAVDTGKVTDSMKSARQEVKLNRPKAEDVEAAFDDYSPFTVLNKYMDKINAARNSGDNETAAKLERQCNEENQKNLADRLKSLGTDMEAGYYVAKHQIDDYSAEIYQPDTVNTKLGCMDVRPATSGSGRDTVPAFYVAKEYVRISDDEAKARLASQVGSRGDITIGGISSSEETAIRTYTYAGAASSALRKGEKSEQAERIQAVIDRTVSPERTVYRGVKGDYADKLRSMNVGEITTEKGFASTSSDKELAQKKFAGEKGVLMEIRVPPGYGKSLSVSYYSNKPEESEVLLNSNARLKLISKDNNHLVMEASWDDRNDSKDSDDAGGGQWKTVNGTPVFFDKSGEAVAGPAAVQNAINNISPNRKNDLPNAAASGTIAYSQGGTAGTQSFIKPPVSQTAQSPQPRKKPLSQKCKEALTGIKTSSGHNVNGASAHAVQRIGMRHIKPKKVAETLQNPDRTMPGNKGNRTVYIKDSLFVVFDNDDNEVKTTYRRPRRKNANRINNGQTP